MTVKLKPPLIPPEIIRCPVLATIVESAKSVIAPPNVTVPLADAATVLIAPKEALPLPEIFSASVIDKFPFIFKVALGLIVVAPTVDPRPLAFVISRIPPVTLVAPL